MPRACATAEKLRKSQHMRKTRVSLLKMESVIGLLMVVLEADYFFSVMKLKTKGMLQNSTFVGLALPLFLIAFFGYLVWLQFFSLLKPVNYSFSRRFLECFRC